MRAAGVCAVDAAVDTMVLLYSLAFPADWKFLASGSDVKVVRAYRLQFPLDGVFAVVFSANAIFFNSAWM